MLEQTKEVVTLGIINVHIQKHLVKIQWSVKCPYRAWNRLNAQ